MANVSWEFSGNILLLRIPIDKPRELSKSKKSWLVATTNGPMQITNKGEAYQLNLNLYQPADKS